MTIRDQVPLTHLAHLVDDVGIVEHSCLERPRTDEGYCTDDAGRLLGVATSLLAERREARRMASVALRFLARAHEGGSRFRLRLGPQGRWTEDPISDDATGRALHGLGTAAARSPWSDVRSGALELFEQAASWRSHHPRSIAHAALGATAILQVIPDHRIARLLVDDAADLLPRHALGASWGWPEQRLTYSNAVIPEALLAAAIARRDSELARDALGLLAWLVAEESMGEHFSFTPVDGRGPDDEAPAFDQQPIEAWAMADACARAYEFTGDSSWADAVIRAARWFEGHNDSGTAVFDSHTGGGFDGLERLGVNRNQGAESTMAAAVTLERARAMQIERHHAFRQAFARESSR
jgi:hypothetical protein